MKLILSFPIPKPENLFYSLMYGIRFLVSIFKYGSRPYGIIQNHIEAVTIRNQLLLKRDLHKQYYIPITLWMYLGVKQSAEKQAQHMI